MIPVVWWNGARGNWDAGLLMRIFEQHPEQFPQINEKNIPQLDRAIVIVVGRPPVLPLKNYLSKMKSGVVIMTGDEECAFECEKAVPNHLQMWTQCYAPHRSYIKERLLLGTPNRPGYKINSHLPKKYLWSFIGQVQNPHRDACVEALKKMDGGFLHVADGFGGQGNGIEHQEYLDIMCQSKFVICPSGSFTADTFRVYEAMECGAIPIADKRSPRDAVDFNYWSETCHYNGMAYVSEWSEETLKWMMDHEPTINALPMESYGELYTGVEQNFWWFHYKKEVVQKLLNIANG